MKVITYNLNGIRSALNKGLLDFIRREDPDVLCFQELKAQPEQIDAKLFEDLGFHCYWHAAEKKGYSGVGILTKTKPSRVIVGCENEQFDIEGRVLSLIMDDVCVVSAYFPSGTTGDIRQQVKYDFLDHFYDWVLELKKSHQNLVVCGDYNICHKEIDIHNPKSNKNSSGFLPEERAWMDKWFNAGFQDSFRVINPDPHHYTWWSYRAGARKKNKGWRIDYISTTPEIDIVDAGLYSEDVHSDHCASYAVLSN